jgi:hypothetical protein
MQGGRVCIFLGGWKSRGALIVAAANIVRVATRDGESRRLTVAGAVYVIPVKPGIQSLDSESSADRPLDSRKAVPSLWRTERNIYAKTPSLGMQQFIGRSGWLAGALWAGVWSSSCLLFLTEKGSYFRKMHIVCMAILGSIRTVAFSKLRGERPPSKSFPRPDACLATSYISQPTNIWAS